MGVMGLSTKIPNLKAEHDPAGEPYVWFFLASEGPTYAFTLGPRNDLWMKIPEPTGDTRLRAHFNHYVSLAH